MKKGNIFMTVLSTLTLILILGGFCFSDQTAVVSSAKRITSTAQVKKLARKQVKHATIVDVDKDDEDGAVVYEVSLIKKKKKFDLVYRASDGKLISYEWKIRSNYVKKGSGKNISRRRCRTLAKKQVRKGKIISITKKYSDGIRVFKVKMKKGSKKYELKFHARTGKLLKYEWELTAGKSRVPSENTAEKPSGSVPSGSPAGDSGRDDTENSRISLAQAKTIALTDAGLASSDVIRYTKAELDHEDGTLVYEIEFYTASYKYEYEINAYTGAIHSREKESIYD